MSFVSLLTQGPADSDVSSEESPSKTSNDSGAKAEMRITKAKALVQEGAELERAGRKNEGCKRQN